jgi:hypothetical protein
MQEASLLNTTNQACGLFNEAEVGYLWTSIVPCFMVEISCLSIYNDNFFLFVLGGQKCCIDIMH